MFAVVGFCNGVNFGVGVVMNDFGEPVPLILLELGALGERMESRTVVNRDWRVGHSDKCLEKRNTIEKMGLMFDVKLKILCARKTSRVRRYLYSDCFTTECFTT